MKKFRVVLVCVLLLMMAILLISCNVGPTTRDKEITLIIPNSFKTEYLENEDINLSKISVYVDDLITTAATFEVVKEVTYSENERYTEITYAAKYGDLISDQTFTIKVYDSVANIGLYADTTAKTVYYVDDEFDVNGWYLKVIYSDNFAIIPLKSEMLSSSIQLTEAGNVPLSLSYHGVENDSAANIVVKKKEAATPTIEISSITNNSVEIKQVSNALYSLDNINFQESNIFTDLNGGTQYTAYLYVEESRVYNKSQTVSTTFTTNKNAVDAPEFDVFDITDESFKVNKQEGLDAWCDNGMRTDAGEYWLFYGLQPNTEYEVFAKFVSSSTTYESEVTTKKVTTAAKVDEIVATSSQTFEYNGSNKVPAFELKSGNLVNLSKFSITYKKDGIKVNSAINQGEYEVTISNIDPKYSIEDKVISITISKRDIEVSANALSKVFGEEDKQLTYSITSNNLVFGDVLNGQLVRETGENVGEYDILIGSLSNDNYNILFISNTFEIEKRHISIKIDDKETEFGNNDPVYTYTLVSGTLISGTALDIEYERESGIDVGEYKISIKESNSNYDIAYTTGTLTIVPTDNFIIYVSNVSETYNGESHRIQATPIEGIYYTYTYNGSYVEPIDAGTYEVITTATGSNNYTGTKQIKSTLKILKKEVSAQISNATKVYGEDNPSFTYTFDDDVYEDEFTEASYTTLATKDSKVGKYTIFATGILNNNYQVKILTGTLEITKKSATITASIAAKEYGDEDPIISYETSGVINGDTFEGKLSRVSGEVVGDYNILIGSLNNPNYDINFVSNTFTITQRNITVKANNSSKVYGAEDPEFTYTLSSGILVGSDTLSGTLSREKGEDVGTYDISGGLINTNYNISYEKGTFTINPSNKFTIEATGDEVIYDGQEKEIVATAVDGISFTYKYNDEDAKPVNAGTYNVTITGEGSGNYTGIKIKNVVLTILPREISITVDNKEKTYGDNNPSFTYSLLGEVVEGDNLGDITYSTLATTNSSIGEYAISASGLNNINYTISYNDGKLTITKKSLEVIADSGSKTYGDNDSPLTYVANGLIVGDSLLGSLSREEGENVGEYNILIGTLNNSNYDITYTGGVYQINRAELTITVDNKEKEKFQENPEFTSTIVGIKRGDIVVPTYICDATIDSLVGTYDINATYENDNYLITINKGTLTINAATNFEIYAEDLTTTYNGEEKEIVATSNGNVIFDYKYNGLSIKPVNVGVYSVTITATGTGDYEGVKVANKTLTITKKSLTITADNKAKTYGDSDPIFTYTASGLLTSDSLLGSLSREPGENVGEYDILIGSLNNSNYDITLSEATLTINKKALTITADNKAKTYGDSDPVFTYTTSGLLTNDSLTGSLSREEGENVGEYDILIGSLNNSNYDVTFNSAILTISKAALSITVDNKVKIYGEDNPNLTYSILGLKNGDEESILNIEISTLATKTSDVGTYDITLNYTDNSNYNISLTNGTLTINQSTDFEIAAENKSITYDGLSHGISVDEISGITYEYKYDGSLLEPINCGEYTVTITATGGGNYKGSKTEYVTLTINPKSITITADNKTSIYGEDLEELTYSYSDTIISGNNFSGSIQKANGIAVGNYAISIGSLKLTNYEITFIDAVYTITKRSITAKVNNEVKTYGDVNPTFTYSITSGSIAFGDLIGTASYSTSAAKNSSVGNYDVMLSNLYNSNYNIAFEKGNLEIIKREITISANENTYTFNAYEHTPNITINGLINGDTVSVSYDQKAINAGSYNLTATINSTNYELVGNNKVNVVVNKANQEIIIKANEFSYDGKAHSVVAQLGFGEGEISYENNSYTNVGSYKAIVHVSATSNFNALNQEVDLIINAVNVTIESATVSDITYGQMVSSGTITGVVTSFGVNISGTFTFVDGTEKYNVGSYSVDVLFTPTDTNYSSKQGKASVTVVRKTIEISVNESGKGYGNSDPIITYSLNGLESGDSYAAIITRDSGEAIGEYGYKVTDNGLGNYKPVIVSSTKFYILDKLVRYDGYSSEFTYRVGTNGTYTLKLSYMDSYSISDLIVEFSTNKGTASGTFNGSTVQFSGSGLVKLSLKLKNKYNVVFDEKVFEVVAGANNIYSFSISSSQDTCLHCDINGTGQFAINEGYTLYGNGYTIDYSTFTIPSRYYNAVYINGTLDNVKIVGQYAEEGYDKDDGNYARTFSMVVLRDNGKIKNCHIEYGRYGVKVATINDALIENTTFIRSLYCIYVMLEGTGSKLTVRDCDFISEPEGDNLPSIGIYVDTNPCGTFTLRFEGDTKFHNLVTKDEISKMLTTYQTLLNSVWNDSSMSSVKHTINGTQYIDIAIGHFKGDGNNFNLDIAQDCSLYGKFTYVDKDVTVLTESYSGRIYTYDSTKVDSSYMATLINNPASKVNHKYSPLPVKPNSSYKSTITYTVEPGAYYTFDHSGYQFIKYGENMEYTVDSITQISTSFGQYEQTELGGKFYLGQYKVRFKIYDKFDNVYQYFETLIKIQDSSPAPTIVFTYSSGKGSGVSSSDPFLWQGEQVGTIFDPDYNSNIDLFFGVVAYNYKGNVIPRENYTITIGGSTFSNTDTAVFSRTTNNEKKNTYTAVYTVYDEQGKSTVQTRYIKIDSCASSPDNGTAPSVTRSVEGYGSFASHNIGEICMVGEGTIVISTGNNTYYKTTQNYNAKAQEVTSKRVVSTDKTKDSKTLGVRTVEAKITVTVYYTDSTSINPSKEYSSTTTVSFSKTFYIGSNSDSDVNSAINSSASSAASSLISSLNNRTRIKYDSSGNLTL